MAIVTACSSPCDLTGLLREPYPLSTHTALPNDPLSATFVVTPSVKQRKAERVGTFHGSNTHVACTFSHVSPSLQLPLAGPGLRSHACIATTASEAAPVFAVLPDGRLNYAMCCMLCGRLACLAHPVLQRLARYHVQGGLSLHVES